MRRNLAYTTTRSDVFAMVPSTAMQILDVGCSDGALGATLKADQRGRSVSGIETVATFVDVAVMRLDQVINADIETFNWAETFPLEFFDCIIFADVLEHLRDPYKIITTANQYLKPNGHIVISMPNIRHHSALYSIMVRGTFPRRERGIFDDTHLRWFTLNDGRTLLKSRGLIIDAESYSLRIGDKGGGLMNRIINSLPNFVAGFGPIREFLTYQFCLRAVKSS